MTKCYNVKVKVYNYQTNRWEGHDVLEQITGNCFAHDEFIQK